MTTPSTPHDRNVERLAKAQEATGRQDLVSPPPTTEKSDPTPVDVQRGKHVWLGFLTVGAIFVAIIIYFLVTQ